MTIFNFIKSHIAIFDVVNQYTTLKKAGNYWKARCPFHHEKTASFTVSPHKDIFYCFGCHASGDVISFIAKVENCSQIEAAQLLADRNNLEIPHDISFEHSHQDLEKKESYFETCKAIALWCQDQLKKAPTVIRYLHERGFDQTSIDSFYIGYFPGGLQSVRNFTNALRKHNILEQQLLDTHFLTQGKKVLYSPFEERIIFPIMDHLGRFCGFGGRTYKPEDTRAKYYNSRENDFFTKGSLLFGLSQAKKAIQKENRAFLVEGYTDCIAMAQHGHINTVATLGTACTIAHLKQLSRLAPYLYVLYDGDQAGNNAVLRLTQLCWQSHMELKVISLPNNQDPDSFLKAGNDLNPHIENAQDIFVFFIEAMAKDLAQQTVHEKVKTARTIVDIIRPIDDPLKRDMLLQKAATTFDVPFESLKKELRAPQTGSHKQAPDHIQTKKAVKQGPIALSALEKRITAAILNNTDLLEQVNVSLLASCMHSSLANVLNALVQAQNNEQSYATAISSLDIPLQQLVYQLMVAYEKPIETQEFQELVVQLHKKHWKTLVAQVKLQLAHAQESNDQKRVQILLRDFMALKETLTHTGNKA